jgi:hypothetical protein
MRFTTARGALVALLAVVVVSVVGSASASAEVCKKKAGSKNWTLCINGQKTASAQFKFALKEGTTAVWTGPEWEKGLKPRTLICSKEAGTGYFEAGSIRELKLTLESCKGKNGSFEGCTTGSITTNPLTGKFGPLTENVAFTTRTSGTDFLDFVLGGGECIERGIQTLRFSSSVGEECTLVEAEVELSAHTIKCEGAKSHLEWVGHPGLSPFSIEDTMERPVLHEHFSIIEGI